MHKFNPVSRNSRRTLLPLILALAVSQAYAAPVKVIGAEGSRGADGATPGAAGADGGTGGTALAVAGALDTEALAIGGNGGRGGSGADGPTRGGNGGNGGKGGFAEARHVIRGDSAPVTARASAQGGWGGNYGYRGWGADGSENGRGGESGNALAVIDATGTGLVSGTASAEGGGASSRATNGTGGDAAVALRGTGATVVLTGTAIGGRSGDEWRAGTAGMTGGSASGTLTGAAGTGGLTGELNLTGGRGTETISTDAGIHAGNGGDTVARNPFAVTTSGALTLTLTGTGGAGGDTRSGMAGLAGKADLDVSVDGGASSNVKVAVNARGGNGGSANRSDVSPGAVASAGGLARGVSHASGKGAVWADVSAIGGDGGWHEKGAAGNGGLAVADSVARTSGSEVAFARAHAIGGNGGGGGDWQTPAIAGHGGNGGTAQASAFAANTGGGTASAMLLARGGDGGAASTIGRGGKGGDAIAIDNVAGTTSGELRLSQQAAGGDGGRSSGNEASGDGGNAISRLSLSDSQSVDVQVFVSAYGGNAGTGSIRGKGGAGQAELNLVSTRPGAKVQAGALASGGRGAAGGAVLARSIVSAQGEVSNGASASSNRTDAVQPTELLAFARSESIGKVTTRADVTDDQGLSSAARARSESVSSRGASTAESQGWSRKSVDVSAYSAAHGRAPSVAQVKGVGAERVTLQATSVSTNGPLAVETSISRVGVNEGFRALQGYASTNISGVMPQGAIGETLSVASFRPADATSLAATPKVAAAFESIDLVGEGVMHAGSAAAMTADEHQRTTASFRFDTTAEGSLTLGLIGFTRSDQLLGQLGLSVFSHGAELYAHTFGSMDEVDAFFRDNALSLGTLAAGSQDIMITADFLFDAEGNAGFRYVLGVEALAAVPEPGTWIMVLLGLTLIVVRVRKPARS